jgi:hypothetical protein
MNATPLYGVTRIRFFRPQMALEGNYSAYSEVGIEHDLPLRRWQTEASAPASKMGALSCPNTISILITIAPTSTDVGVELPDLQAARDEAGRGR